MFLTGYGTTLSLQASELQVRRLAGIHEQPGFCGHAGPWLYPHPLCLRHPDGHDGRRAWASTPSRSGCATPSTIRSRRAKSTRPSTAFRFKTCGIKEAIRKPSKKIHLGRTRKRCPNREGPISYGVGISGTAYHGGARQLGHQSCGAIIRICEDGTVNFITGATDCGQGSDTVLAMIAAEELGVRYEDISIKRVDTAYTPVDPGSYGSRVTLLAGQATQTGSPRRKKTAPGSGAKPGVSVRTISRSRTGSSR